MSQEIFIIDDDLVSQFATRYCIEQTGLSFEVTTCGSAEEGLDKCATWVEEYGKLPDIIFLDLSKLSGDSLLPLLSFWAN